MTIGNATQEKTNTSVKCQAYSANPASSVNMEFFINATNQSHITPDVTTVSGSNNGLMKIFVFTFTTDRKQNGMTARCHLLWDGKHINTTEENLNITCE